MMNNMMDNMTTEQLLDLRDNSADTLTSLIDEVDDCNDMLGLLQDLASGGDVLDTVADWSMDGPATARMALDTLVTTFVTVQDAQHAKDELESRTDLI